MRKLLLILVMAVLLMPASTISQGRYQPDWTVLQDETMRHFQSLVRFDTTDPPGGEEPAAMYLKEVLEKEGIAVQVFPTEPKRVNIVARLKGNGSRRPLLMMGHTDTVNVDPAKWKFPPFSATRDGGWVYGRGTLDDKDNVTASLMTMIMLKRLNVPLARDVIFLAEAGEEGTTRVGIEFMVNQHYPDIDAEYCLAEGGGVTRTGGQVKFASIQTSEKIPRQIELTATGISGHGSIPLVTNPIVHLASAVGAAASWKGDLRINETTGAYFKRLADISSPEEAKQYRAALSLDSKVVSGAYDYFMEHEPRHASMLRSSISPNIFQAGYRVNVIPSEAKATLDVRLLPGEDADKYLEQVKKIINDPAIDVRYAARSRPPTPVAKLDTEAFHVLEAAVKRNYNTVTLPTMSTGATDMSYLRAKGMQCYGIGPASDSEDGPLGFGSHSDQERILESELFRFVRFNWDAVIELAAVK